MNKLSLLTAAGVLCGVGDADLIRELASYPKGPSAAQPDRGKIYRRKPGDTIKMSDRQYVVANDGSFRRVAL